MKFTKMEGAGNDYVYIDVFKEKVDDAPALARKVSDRHFGVGSDGLILIAPSEKADVRMIMYNADGSEGAMCGNGIRCLAKYAYEHGIAKKKQMRVETKSGIRTLELHVDANEKVHSVTVNMGVAKVGERETITIQGTTYTYIPVNVGNPHAIIFVDNITNEQVLIHGPLIETDARFPDRTNVEFVKAESSSAASARVWERGSGETLACGTGACAIAAAGNKAGHFGSKVAIRLPGGVLQIELSQDGHVLMTGPAVEVFSGEL